MAWHSHGTCQQSLVDALVRNGLVATPEVEQALRRVDRGVYCAPGAAAYQDAPQRTPYASATISAPHMHAQCLELVARFVRRAAEQSVAAAAGAAGGGPVDGAPAPPPPPPPRPVRILDVGCGTGYLLAALAHLATAYGAQQVEVVGVERLAPLARAARASIPSGGMVGGNGGGVSVRVTVVEGDGHAGWAQGAPYDVIHVGAAVSGGVPRDLLEQLAPGGVLVAPLVDGDDDDDQGGRERATQALWMVEKAPLLDGGGDGSMDLRRTRVMPVVYVPLVKGAAGGAAVVLGSN